MITAKRKFQKNSFILIITILLINFIEIETRRLTSIDKDAVDTLVKQWAPLVWLAPGEKFMPLDVNEFLNHVHAEEKNSGSSKKILKEYWNKMYNRNQNDNDKKWEKQGIKIDETNENLFKRNFYQNLPHGILSEKSYLVTNHEIDDLLYNSSSFLYGKNPNKFPVPIYAVVKICNAVQDKPMEILPPSPISRGPFIPIQGNNIKPTINIGNVNDTKTPLILTKTKRKKRDLNESKSFQRMDDNLSSTNEESNEITKGTNEFMANIVDNVKFTSDSLENDITSTNEILNDDRLQNIPNFHVTYWMFYPYSQGKPMCTISLGPLGRIPIPVIFGMCMGSRKDIGSHIGDWEHMSLYFGGGVEPNAMYVSAHDAGAYYSYNRLTGTFEFRSQETRKGILQRPNFPKTVITSSNHPILFAAQGSHGLWTAPGKHRFVRVPRLYDINGFGTPWYTWKAVEVAYENLRSHRSLTPDWFSFKGKWGNPKSKCHPLRRIGLNFCEYADGPTGIPLKQAHFQCTIS